jgi:hypothetical protein
VRRVVKVSVWVAVFAGCAGVGAYLAANSDPFPPGVVDPGAAANTGPDGSATPSPVGNAWIIQIDVRTFHELFVGGRCTARWTIDAGLSSADGELDGIGAATRTGELRCDEPNAQVQAERIDLRAAGTVVGDELRFGLDVTGRSPTGAQDLSGFVETVPTLRFEIPAEEGATATFDITLPDGDRGTYGAVGTAVISAPPPA